MWLILPLRRRHASSITSIPLAEIEPAYLARDLTCIHCGYNLRTLHSSGKCPECGRPVNESLTLNAELAKSRPAWLWRLSGGSILLFLARVLLIATYAAAFKRNGGFVTEYALAVVCASAFIVLYAAGIALLTSREHVYSSSTMRNGAAGLRILAAISLSCLATGLCYQTICTITARGSTGMMMAPIVYWYWPSLLLFLVGWILYCWCVVREFLFLAQLARRLPSQFMAKHCIVAGIGAGVSGSLMTIAAPGIINQWEELGSWWVIVAMWFVFLIWTGLLNLDCSMRFRQQALLAK